LTPPRTITVFGGTGFLGRWVVHDLIDRGFSVRIASRHPEPGRTLRQSGDAEVEIDEQRRPGISSPSDGQKVDITRDR